MDIIIKYFGISLGLNYLHIIDIMMIHYNYCANTYNPIAKNKYSLASLKKQAIK